MAAETIELRDGSIVLVEAVTLALALETRGHEIASRSGALVVSNGSQLTSDDRAEIQRLKRHLLHIAGYGTEVVEDDRGYTLPEVPRQDDQPSKRRNRPKVLGLPTLPGL